MGNRVASVVSAGILLIGAIALTNTGYAATWDGWQPHDPGITKVEVPLYTVFDAVGGQQGQRFAESIARCHACTLS